MTGVLLPEWKGAPSKSEVRGPVGLEKPSSECDPLEPLPSLVLVLRVPVVLERLSPELGPSEPL